jgi:dipeptidyl aminopeptidase/acylaminoacyl peptidase
VIPADGGEALPVSVGEEEVHAFAWSPDSKTLYFATRTPWTKAQKDAYKKEWKDVLQYRESERGDVMVSIPLAYALANRATLGSQPGPENETGYTPGSHVIGATPLRVKEIVVSPDGSKLAFNTDSISERQEDIASYEIYVLDLNQKSSAPRQLTHNEGIEDYLHWSPDSKHIFFYVQQGSVEGPYQDVQGRVYWADATNGKLERWAANFAGSINDYAVLNDGTLLAAGRMGTEVQLYRQTNPTTAFEVIPGLAGTYETLAASEHSPRIAFVHSTLQEPTEVYWADDPGKLKSAQVLTAFNQEFTRRELPQGKPYRWTSTDGTPVEGMLIYPPGKFEARNLPMFVLIHGGPADADGNHFEADWYQWAQLAATDGWLVFEPNYRGSTGYGDKFTLGLIPHLVSVPGRDILSGVDALVRDGIADPDHLTIGGYSYGGYMTNWLITQTTRFKAAVSGAGAVEHAANWGNDDTTFDDTFFLGGRPWEAQKNYIDEAALFIFGRVKTPTHVVAGSADIRVAVAEDYLMEHALHSLGIPSTLLIFPGEGHSLKLNPWHGKIKVREELKWLKKYCPLPGTADIPK